MGETKMTTANEIKNLFPVEEGKISLIMLEEHTESLGSTVTELVPFIEAGFKHVAYKSFNYTVISNEETTLESVDIEDFTSVPPQSTITLSNGREAIVYYSDLG
jgi:hypothetical protein